MFHSIPVSEPAAIVGGTLVGLLGYALLGVCGVSHDGMVWGAMITGTIANVAIGGSVNGLVLDILALLIVRPVSALVGAKLLGLLLS